MSSLFNLASNVSERSRVSRSSRPGWDAVESGKRVNQSNSPKESNMDACLIGVLLQLFVNVCQTTLLVVFS